MNQLDKDPFLLNLTQMQLTLDRRQLVEGLAGGGEGSLGVGQDPVHLLSHSLIESSYMCSKTRFNLIFSPGKDIWKVHITSLSNKAGNSNLEI